MTPLSMWIGFHALLLLLLGVEALLLRRQASAARGYIATVLWIAGALAFAAAIHMRLAPGLTTEFLAGYAIEESLSIDNLFVFVLLFQTFRIAGPQQRRVLFWGILLAAAMRAGFIAAGVQLLQKFAWVTYLFGAFLLYAAIKMVLPASKKSKTNAGADPAWLRLMRRFTPISDSREHFFATEPCPDNGNPRTMPSMLFVALIAIAVTDLVFALDSIPAVLSLTKHPFIAYTSNVMAVMGLRSLFFVLTDLLARIRFLHYGLAAVLGFAAVKMLGEHYFTLSATTSLGIILGLLAVTVAISLIAPAKTGTAH